MSQAVAWMDGEWNAPDELSIPVSDRGLRLADGVFETILTIGSQPQLLSLVPRVELPRLPQGAEEVLHFPSSLAEVVLASWVSM